MSEADPIAARLRELVRQHGRELAGEILLRVGLGLVFSLLTFGFVFWVAVIFGWYFAWQLGLGVWQFAEIVTAVFFVVAHRRSAWSRVDPLARSVRL